MTTVKRFAEWATQSGLELDRETLLSPDVIERYVLTGAADLSPYGRATQRAQLTSMGRTLTKRAAWPPKRTRLPARRIAEPYSPAQVARIWEAAPQQVSDYRKRIALGAVSLGLGAGIAAREYRRVSGDSVVAKPYGALVTVCGVKYPRAIPVVGIAAETLLELADGRRGLPLVADRIPTHRNATNSLVSRLDMPRSVGNLNVTRLRTTWLVAMLNARVPFRAVIDMYGPTTTNLTELLDYLGPIDATEIADILRPGGL